MLDRLEISASALSLAIDPVMGLNMIDCLAEIWQECLRIFCRRKMAHSFHGLENSARDLVCCGLAGGWRAAIVVLTSEHVDWTNFGIDLSHSPSPIPALEIEGQVSFEDTDAL